MPVSARWTDDLHRLFNEPVVADWLFLTGPPTREEVEARTKGHEAVWRERGYGMFVVLEKATDRFVARVGAMVTPETGRVEIAWTTMTEAHGKGYASEGGQGLNRLHLRATRTSPHSTATSAPTTPPRAGWRRRWVSATATRAFSMTGRCATTKCRRPEGAPVD